MIWQALTSFTNQALKGVPKTHQVDLLSKYQVVSKQDVIEALRKYFLPLFDPSSSIAVTVTAPSKYQEIRDGLRAAGFEVSRRTLAIDTYEATDSEGDSDGMDTGSGSEDDKMDGI